jgi:surfactin synthase thioesterase subunit/glycosyltransferase involved in cell wall biosynthesis
MRILLVANASYAPPRGGATRSNLVWLRHLAEHGHSCRVLSASLDGDFETTVGGIQIRGVHELPSHAAVLGEEIASFDPDYVLVSSEDISHLLLREAGRAAPGRVVYLAHTPQFYPFGPESWNPDPAAAAIVRAAHSVVAIGQHMAAYIKQHLGVDAAVIHPPIYGEPPFPNFANPDAGLILMINPCQVKGIPIFLELAQRFPHLPFAALRGWGTTSEALPGITLLENVPSIDEVLARTRVLLMPSLWYEGFGLIAMEAMLRGIPVISSNSGGLIEAKQGTHYVIPVRPIERYLPEFDETHMPKPVVPPQDIEPWAAALEELTTNRAAYEAESARARAAAEAFVSPLHADQLEKHLHLRVLLAHNSLYYPAHGGGDKSNRLLMEALAARGHRVRVAARRKAGAAAFTHNGVDVRTLPLDAPMKPFVAEQIADFRPNVILTSTDDPALLLFDAARQAPNARVVYLVRATIAVPFGPDSSMPSPAKTETLRQADGILGVSEYVAKYVREQGRMEAVHVPISLMEGGPWPELGRFDNPYVVLVNPCAVKGIDIFLELARRMPGVRFAAVPTWGTNAADLARLRNEANVTILDPVDDIDDLLRQARVVLVPSLWAEARSRIVVEAMLRGVPVIASDAGGIREAKLGVPYLLPVKLITRYRPALDENMVPVAEVPPQDVGPWQAALERLTADEGHWREIAAQSREAAVGYAANLTVEPFERYLYRLTKRSQSAPAVDKRKLLAQRLLANLKARPAGGLKLFCFPPAGAGVVAYLRWMDKLPGVAVIPVHLPQAETMEALVAALMTTLAGQLQAPYAFFGHSLGAGVAFELTRALRRAGVALPRVLIVSATKAPQLRTAPGAASEMSEMDLELAHLPDAAAQLRLSRNYVYRPEPPLAIPIVAYGGAADPNIRREHLEAWSEQTTGGFLRREFAGGHFYLREEGAVLAAIREDLKPALVRESS